MGFQSRMKPSLGAIEGRRCVEISFHCQNSGEKFDHAFQVCLQITVKHMKPKNEESLYYILYILSASRVFKSMLLSGLPY